MEDVTVDVRKPLNGRNLKSMGLIDKVLVKPPRNTSWEELKDQREKANKMYLFTKIDPLKVIARYMQDLEAQVYDIFGFGMDWLLYHRPNFLKRKREPFQKTTI